MKQLPRLVSLLIAATLAMAGTASAGSPAQTFFNQLRSLCGKTYAGKVQVDQPASADNPFAGQPLRMRVHACGRRDDTLRIGFDVGQDRSRTWVITRTESGLRLKHDHRHADGTPDALTMYGGDARMPGTITRQEFPVDAESVALFEREGRAASTRNTWALVHVPGQRFVYELARPDGRLFRVLFDLTPPKDAAKAK